jgi:hypothetical protein
MSVAVFFFATCVVVLAIEENYLEGTLSVVCGGEQGTWLSV